MTDEILTDVVRMLSAQRGASRRYLVEALASLEAAPTTENLIAVREHCRVVAQRFEEALSTFSPERVRTRIQHEFIGDVLDGDELFRRAGQEARQVESLADAAARAPVPQASAALLAAIRRMNEALA